MATDLKTTLDNLITSLTKNNTTVQEKKESGTPWGYIVAGIVALLSLIGIGIAMYYANKRSKELATAMTTLETQKVDLAQQEYNAKALKNEYARTEMLKVVEAKKKELEATEAALTAAKTEHDAQLLKVKALKSWDEMNAGSKS